MGADPLEIDVVAMTPAHAPAVLRVFAAGIAGGNATFEVAAPSWEAWDAAHLAEHRVVAVAGGEGAGEVVGWAALAPTSAREVYAGVVDGSVYVDPAVAGRGVGDRLLGAVLASSERGGIWTVQAGIFPENTVSLALHRKHGFRVVGTRERVGLMRVGPRAGTWRDVVLLERRVR